MTSDTFIKRCKEIVKDYYNNHVDATDPWRITDDRIDSDVYVVWYCRALGNHKALLSTTVPDGMYYELTYNGEDDEIYFDAYKKWENVIIKGSN